MDILVRSLLWLCFLYLINLGLDKVRAQPQQKAEEPHQKEILSVPEQSIMNGEDGTARGFFDEFPVLWDAFEEILQKEILKWIAERSEDSVTAKGTRISILYKNIGFSYWWCRGGAGYPWKTKMDEIFFESCYRSTKSQLIEYYDLDTLAAPKLENIERKDAGTVYAEAIKPLFDIRKQELIDAFAQMAKKLEEPLPYTFKIPLDDKETALVLGFQKRYKKRNTWNEMDGYGYSFNGRSYTDVRAFMTETIEKLSDDVSIAKDTFGDMVLRRYTEIPTFDSGDREWDGSEIEYLMFDGKDIHLIVSRGGYRIAYLIFFEKLLSADARMKPLFCKMNWPINDIEWV